MSITISYYGVLKAGKLDDLLDETSKMLEYWKLKYRICTNVTVNGNNSIQKYCEPVNVIGGEPPFAYSGITIQIFIHEERNCDTFDIYFRDDTGEIIDPDLISENINNKGVVSFGILKKVNKMTARIVFLSLLCYMRKWVDFTYIEDGWEDFEKKYEIIDFRNSDKEYKEYVTENYL